MSQEFKINIREIQILSIESICPRPGTVLNGTLITFNVDSPTDPNSTPVLVVKYDLISSTCYASQGDVLNCHTTIIPQTVMIDDDKNITQIYLYISEEAASDLYRMHNIVSPLIYCDMQNEGWIERHPPGERVNIKKQLLEAVSKYEW